MRGKRPSPCCGPRPSRIIPAHAGQTNACDSSASSCPDHPRACGANIISAAFYFAYFGSSPRMRGKHGTIKHAADPDRIIPAHAGQTTSPPGRSPASPDHPRACGANTSTRSAYSTLVGSSPRMRGKLGFGSTRQCRPRIIPAHAGQTDDAVFSMLRHPDHPRACGANSRSKNLNPRRLGSSPRMRGKRQLCDTRHLRLRIIPAHAGQTATGRRFVAL